MCLPVGTVVVDPAIVDDQRQAKLLLERRQSFGKQVSRRLIEVGSAAQRIGAFPSAFMSLPVEPAVELNVAQSNVHVPQFVAHAQQRAGIAKLVLEAVVVGRSVIGPISEIFQAEVGIVGWAPLAGQIGQEAAQVSNARLMPDSITNAVVCTNRAGIASPSTIIALRSSFCGPSDNAAFI